MEYQIKLLNCRNYVFIIIRLLLLRYTNSSSSPAGSLGVLTTHTQAPIVTHTSVGTDLLQPFQVLTELRIQVGRCQLAVFTIDNILLPVEEPVRDFVLPGVRHDSHNLFHLKTKKKHSISSTFLCKIEWFDKI